MFAEAGLTVTEATGTGVTVKADVPLFPSLVAVIVAAPAATPVTRPLAFTVAIAGVLDAQVMTRPVSGAPVESMVTAESCRVDATRMLATAGLSATVATGTLITEIAATLLFPSLVPVMVAEPAVTPAT